MVYGNVRRCPMCYGRFEYVTLYAIVAALLALGNQLRVVWLGKEVQEEIK
jgi:hypothetical protein